MQKCKSATEIYTYKMGLLKNEELEHNAQSLVSCYINSKPNIYYYSTE
jgi:hypothetical protein